MKKTSTTILTSAAMIAAMGFSMTLTARAAAMEQCPGKFIRMVIPNPAGGVGDLIGRVYAEKAAGPLGQPIIIENHAGATTTIGTDLVAKSKPDGCTILSLTTSGVVASVLRDKLPYNLERDLVPIIGIGSLPMVLAVPATSNIRTFADLTAVIRSPNGLTYASGGAGTLAHLSAARLVKDIGGSGTHVPFRGNSDATQALIGNQVQLFFPSTAEAIPLVKGGKIRVLGVTSTERVAGLADVPTMKELGFADFHPTLWYALLAPKGTPQPTITAMSDAFGYAAKDSSVKEKLAALGFATEALDPASVSALMKSEGARWGKVIKDNNISSSD